MGRARIITAKTSQRWGCVAKTRTNTSHLLRLAHVESIHDLVHASQHLRANLPPSMHCAAVNEEDAILIGNSLSEESEVRTPPLCVDRPRHAAAVACCCVRVAVAHGHVVMRGIERAIFAGPFLVNGLWFGGPPHPHSCFLCMRVTTDGQVYVFINLSSLCCCCRACGKKQKTAGRLRLSVTRPHAHT